MKRFASVLVATMLTLATGCATNLGTGERVIDELYNAYPITVGLLVEAHLDTRERLRIYLQVCEDGDHRGPICDDTGFRVLAMVHAEKKSLLERIDQRYLELGKEKPVYVYGPACDGMEEIILVPHCQQVVALGIWDPHLLDYVFYSPGHGSGSFVQSPGFEAFLEVTGRAAGIVRKAAK